MYKVPIRHKRSISQELKKFVPLVNSLQARGKSATEEDTRILLNDIFHYVLGYDKYHELKTELRDKGGRIDYVVKLNDGPFKNKADRFDFVVEAKASAVDINQAVVDQTLKYCLTTSTDYFIVTNSVKWQLYKVKSGKNASATLVHDVNLGTSNDFESLAEQFYLFSKASYLNGDWKDVTKQVKATKTEDVVAVILSDKIIRSIARELSTFHNLKVSEEAVKDIVENQIIKAEVSDVNTKMIKKLNSKPTKNKTSEDMENSTETLNEDVPTPDENNEPTKVA